MNDFSDFIKSFSNLAKEKISQIVIMGGLNEDTLLPDEKSYNHAVSINSANDVFNFAVKNNIKWFFRKKWFFYGTAAKNPFWHLHF